MKVGLYPQDIEVLKEVLKTYLKARFRDDTNVRLQVLARSHIRKLGKKLADLEWEDQDGELTLSDEEIVALSLASGHYLSQGDMPELFADTLRRMAFHVEPRLLAL